MSSFFSSRDNAAVEDLLSQAKDAYVLEQVAKINCAGFSDDSVLPSNLETRLRRLKSLPVSSSSSKLLSTSKSMESYLGKKNRAGNVSSVSAFSKSSCPLDSSVQETRIFSGTKRTPSVSSRSELGESSGSRRTGSSSSSRFPRGNVSSVGSSSLRYSRQGNVLTPTTQTLKLVPKEKSRFSSHSFNSSTELASPSSDQDQKEGTNRKSKLKLNTKFLYSWFDKLSPTQAMGCLRHTPNKSSPNSKIKTSESSNKEVYSELEEELRKERESCKDTERVIRKAKKALKRVRRLSSESKFDQLLGMLF
ncbi:PREDICTED: uncharacterized protein LOC104778833 [Camelina sativa]|uniref:Uncharacterized protein LOC104778833 n=1 Tax=Camelina sativa TaxID=90675 RepID=A0ABM0YIT5_CAMSA|nr:PREDICTED: uncharacterized protein LOC104778833 [Camelina sativa]